VDPRGYADNFSHIEVCKHRLPEEDGLREMKRGMWAVDSHAGEGFKQAKTRPSQTRRSSASKYLDRTSGAGRCARSRTRAISS
jgi:hypothetical protein